MEATSAPPILLPGIDHLPCLQEIRSVKDKPFYCQSSVETIPFLQSRTRLSLKAHRHDYIKPQDKRCHHCVEHQAAAREGARGGAAAAADPGAAPAIADEGGAEADPDAARAIADEGGAVQLQDVINELAVCVNDMRALRQRANQLADRADEMADRVNALTERVDEMTGRWQSGWQ